MNGTLGNELCFPHSPRLTLFLIPPAATEDEEEGGKTPGVLIKSTGVPPPSFPGTERDWQAEGGGTVPGTSHMPLETA